MASCPRSGGGRRRGKSSPCPSWGRTLLPHASSGPPCLPTGGTSPGGKLRAVPAPSLPTGRSFALQPPAVGVGMTSGAAKAGVEPPPPTVAEPLLSCCLWGWWGSVTWPKGKQPLSTGVGGGLFSAEAAAEWPSARPVPHGRPPLRRVSSDSKKVSCSSQRRSQAAHRKLEVKAGQEQPAGWRAKRGPQASTPDPPPLAEATPWVRTWPADMGGGETFFSGG